MRHVLWMELLFYASLEKCGRMTLCYIAKLYDKWYNYSNSETYKGGC